MVVRLSTKMSEKIRTFFYNCTPKFFVCAWATILAATTTSNTALPTDLNMVVTIL